MYYSIYCSSHFLPNRRSFKVNDSHNDSSWWLSSKRFVVRLGNFAHPSWSRPIFTISLFETFNCIVVFSIACVPSYTTKLTQLPLLAILYRFIYTVARKTQLLHTKTEKIERWLLYQNIHTDIHVPYLYSRENYTL